MKKILVLTDLSENVTNLTQTAVLLAEKLHADILLFNSYQTIPVTPFYGAGPWIGEDESWWEKESVTQLNKIAMELSESIHSLLPGEIWRPDVTVKSVQGGLAENVKDIITHQDIELVIMGSSNDTGFDHILFGSATKSVMAHATRPVIIIPPGAQLTKISKVFFATDFNVSDIKAVSYLARLARLLYFELEIIHVEPFGESESSEMKDRKIFMNMLEDLRYPELQHTEVHGKEVVSRIIKLCTEKKADLLGLLHQQDSLLIRMLRQSTANDLVETQKLPLIIFPSNMR
ncbi:universal stress protein [Dyadobacter sp. 3J3]|uniref:universal stress protein n=1 Tax=Dyadobacter sp. 3J3 TaxID=2606600 RepID=UPI001359470B|nr:universal stress protein [Dyadobacter sp. 3J3]